MSVKISLYDFFAYTIPGSLYVFVVYELLALLGWIRQDAVALDKLGLAQILAVAVVAYILAMLLTPIANRWFWIFTGRHRSAKQAFEQFKANHPYLRLKVQPITWHPMLAQIRRHNLELSSEIDRYNVTSIMLRNVSLALLMLAILEGFRAFWLAPQLGHLALALLAATGSLLAVRQSRVFNLWFFEAIYESTAALTLEATDFFECIQQSGSEVLAADQRPSETSEQSPQVIDAAVTRVKNASH